MRRSKTSLSYEQPPSGIPSSLPSCSSLTFWPRHSFLSAISYCHATSSLFMFFSLLISSLDSFSFLPKSFNSVCLLLQCSFSPSKEHSFAIFPAILYLSALPHCMLVPFSLFRLTLAVELTLTYPIVIKPPSDVVEEIGILIYDWAVSDAPVWYS